MREIKVRAWVKEVFENEELMYGGYMIESHQIKNIRVNNVSMLMNGATGTGIEYFEQGGLLPGLGTLERLNFDEIELMEYTGIKDQHGKEIFEGDIISYWWSGRKEGKVYFKNGCYFVDNYRLGECPSDMEILGNIYDNPDLLKAS